MSACTQFSAYPLTTLHQTQSRKHDRGAGVSMILRSYKGCTRMLVFTRNINLSITVSIERQTNADIAEDPGAESEEAEEGEAEEGAPVLRAGSPGAPRPRLCAQCPGKGSSVLTVGDHPTPQKQTKQKATPKTHRFPTSKNF